MHRGDFRVALFVYIPYQITAYASIIVALSQLSTDMKNVLIFFFALSCSVHTTRAQLVNNGGSIKIQPGALVFVKGDVEIINGGAISNDGRLEVQGSFNNDANYTSATSEDSLILSGGGNVNLNGGASLLNYVQVNKSANSNTVTLSGSTTIGTKLIYQSGTLSTNPATAFTLNANISVPFEFSPGREIIGKVQRTGWAHGADVVFHQPNMRIATSNGTAPTAITVSMLPQSAGGDPSQAEREVKRSYQISRSGGTGFESSVSFAYADDELNNNLEPNLVAWQFISNEWNGFSGSITREGNANFVRVSGIGTDALDREWKLADPVYTMNTTAILRGAWNGSSMNTNLRNASVIPLNQPYNTTPFNYNGLETVGSIPANVVDWVLVEFRKPSSGQASDAVSSSIIGRKAGFLLSNGTVVETDGVTPIAVSIQKQGAGFMVIRHRNHLAVMSNSLPSNETGIYSNDFRSLTNAYKPAGAASDPMVLLSGGGQYGLWSGDANKNGIVNATDISAIRLAIAGSASGYQFTDVNLSNSINATDISLTRTSIAASASGGTPARTAEAVQSNLPDGITED